MAPRDGDETPEPLPEAECQLMAGAVKYVSRPVPERELNAALADAVRFHQERELLHQWKHLGQSHGPVPGNVIGAFSTNSVLAAMNAPKWPQPQFNEIDRVVRGGPHHEEGCVISRSNST